MTKKWKEILKDIIEWYKNNPNVIFFRNYLLPRGITLEEFNKNCTEGDIPKKYKKLYNLVYEYEEQRVIESYNGLNPDKEMSPSGGRDYLQNYHGWKPKGRDNDNKEDNIADLAKQIANKKREQMRLSKSKDEDDEEKEVNDD